jgi:hypothetical protein
LGGDVYASVVFQVTCTRFLSEQEHGRNVGGVGVGWDVSEEVGGVRKCAIFIAVHYNKVFAPTACMAAMCMVIALAAVEDLELKSVDISMAFLNGDIDAEIYMKIPEGF